MSRKGIEPLIAEIVLITVVIGVSIILVAQQSGIIRKQQTSIEPMLNCVFANAYMTDVIISDGKGTVILRNSGQMPLQVTLQAFDSNSTSLQFLTSMPLKLEVGKLASATFDTARISCNNFGEIRSFTNCDTVRPTWSSQPKCVQ